jgi:hypothetical protein
MPVLVSSSNPGVGGLVCAPPKQVNTLIDYNILLDFRGNRASVPEFPDINAVLCRNKLTPKHTPDSAPSGST